MLSFLQSRVVRTNTATQNPLSYEDGRAFQKFHTNGDEFLMTQTLPATSTRSFLEPPTHYHVSQSERFRIQSGHGNFYLPKRNAGPIAAGPGDVVKIPVGALHRFENASSSASLVVDITLDPADREREECFFRNFFGYLDDSRKACQEPSLFQLLVFLDFVGAPLALQVPGPEWASRWISWIFMKVVGVGIGSYILGYRQSYPEYYKQQAR